MRFEWGCCCDTCCPTLPEDPAGTQFVLMITGATTCAKTGIGFDGFSFALAINTTYHMPWAQQSAHFHAWANVVIYNVATWRNFASGCAESNANVQAVVRLYVFAAPLPVNGQSDTFNALLQFDGPHNGHVWGCPRFGTGWQHLHDGGLLYAPAQLPETLFYYIPWNQVPSETPALDAGAPYENCGLIGWSNDPPCDQLVTGLPGGGIPDGDLRQASVTCPTIQ